LFSLSLLFYNKFNDRLLQRNFFQHFLIIFIKANFKNLVQEINPWAAHSSRSWRVKSCKAQSDKTETAIKNVCLSTFQEFTKFLLQCKVLCHECRETQLRFCRTRSLFLTAFVMMRHCLQLESLKWTTDVNETCHFPFNPVCNLYIYIYIYIYIEIWRWKNAVYVWLNRFIVTWPRADVFYERRFCS
jgi:hypothetical protein